jgi:hypothetical protein
MYPHQRHGWQMVHFGKFGAWLLLMIISFILVTLVHPPQGPVIENADGATGVSRSRTRIHHEAGA